MLGKTWGKPLYREVRKLPLIPSEEELDILIAGCGYKTSTFLQLLKETAVRVGEACNLNWTEIDFKKTIRVTPEKESNPRIFHISDKLHNMLSIIKSRNKGSERPFAKHPRYVQRVFEVKRKKLADRRSCVFQSKHDSFICKAVQTKEEAMRLIEVGFLKADEFDGFHIYKKPK